MPCRRIKVNLGNVGLFHTIIITTEPKGSGNNVIGLQNVATDQANAVLCRSPSDTRIECRWCLVNKTAEANKGTANKEITYVAAVTTA